MYIHYRLVDICILISVNISIRLTLALVLKVTQNPKKGDDLTGEVVHTPATTLPDTHLIKQCMASCHSLTMIQGEFIGDPLDVKMFQHTGWHYSESGADNFPIVRPITQANFNGKETNPELAVLKCFPFSSELQRQSVIVRSTFKLRDFILSIEIYMNIFSKSQLSQGSSLRIWTSM